MKAALSQMSKYVKAVSMAAVSAIGRRRPSIETSAACICMTRRRRSSRRGELALKLSAEKAYDRRRHAESWLKLKTEEYTANMALAVNLEKTALPIWRRRLN